MQFLREHINKLLTEVITNIDIKKSLFNKYLDIPKEEKEIESSSFSFIKFPVEKYGDKVISKLIDIIITENSISEKDFKRYDEAIKEAKNIILNNEYFIKIIDECCKTKKRHSYCAEIIFDKIPEESILISESKKAKTEFQKLENNKIPLTDEERKECFRKDAVWHYGYSINPINGKKEKKVCAVWKSKNKNGDITYITNTHRAYNTAKSLKSIINKYHNFIKGTS